MATLQIRKKSNKTWLHIPSDADEFILSKFYCKTDDNIFKIVEESGSSRKEYLYGNITVYDDTSGGVMETFATSQALMIRLEALKYTGFNRDGDIPTSYIESVVAGTNVTIDNTDPLNPIISSTGGVGDMLKSVYDTDDDGIVDSAKKEIVQFINKSGATITKGTIVYLKSTSSSSTYPEVLKANASTEATSSKTIGAVFEDVANDATGYLVTSGEVRNLNTSSYVIGDKLWLSTTDGLVTTTVPTQPNHAVFIGTVTRAQSVNGRILYAIQNGYELNELHNVLIATPLNDQVLTYETSSSLWKNKTLSVGGSMAIGGAITSATAGSVLFAGAFGVLAQDNANLFWDDINNRLGIGNATPQARLDVRAQGALSTDIAFRVRNSADNANLVSVQGNGVTKIGNSTYNDTFSPLIIGTDGLSAARGTLVNNGNYQDFIFVNTSVSSGNINNWSFGQRRDTAFGNTLGSFQIAGGYAANDGTMSAVGGGFRVPLICNPNGDVIIAGATANAINGNVLIGTTTPSASAKVLINSTTQGFLPPRMTTTQKNAIASPVAGLVVYDSTLGKLCVRTASAWETITSL